MTHKRIALICLLGLSALFTGCIYDKTASNYAGKDTIVMEGDQIGINKAFVIKETEGKFSTQFDFNGTYTLWQFDSVEENLIFDYELELKKGDLKLVIIDPQNKITTVFEQNGKGKITGSENFKLSKGHYRMKLVSKSNSEGKISLKVNCGTVSGGE